MLKTLLYRYNMMAGSAYPGRALGKMCIPLLARNLCFKQRGHFQNEQFRRCGKLSEQEYLAEYLLFMSPATVNTFLRYRGRDAFHEKSILIASRACQPGVIQTLINAGFAVDHRGPDGATALHLAAQNRGHEIAKQLLSLDFPINATDDSG